MLTELSAIALGISMASERILELLKTLFPWLGVQKSLNDDNRERAGEEILRRVIIQFVSIGCCWVTAAFVAGGEDCPEWLGTVPIGEKEISVFIIAFLSSAGSVFWTQIVGYAKAVKEITKVKAQDERDVAAKKALVRERIASFRGTATFKTKLALVSSDTQPDF